MLIILQSPFKDVTFKLIGDDSAPYYFEVEESGKVRIAKDLSTDHVIDYQVQ